MSEQTTELKISRTLVERLKLGKCTLFTGPLISEASAEFLWPPNPARLAFELADDLIRQPERYDLPWVALLYEDQAGSNTLRRRVAERMDNPDYRPTLAQHLVAQLPFDRIVCTAQDKLLHRAHQINRVPVDVILPGNNLSTAIHRLIIMLFGMGEQSTSLKLTEDERRLVWSGDHDLADDLRSMARNESLLFVGYTVNDPELKELYYRLRPHELEKIEQMPRAYMVGLGVSNFQKKYWGQRNVTLYSWDPADFLQELAGELTLPVKTAIEAPRLLSPGEREEKSRLEKLADKRFHINEYGETSADLRARSAMHLVIQMRTSPERSSAEIPPGEITDRAKSESLNKLKDGNIEWSQGNLDLARDYFEEAMRLDPQLTDAYLSLFHLLIEKGNLDAALQVYQDMLVESPQQAFLPPKRYQIQEILGQIDLGVSYLVYDQKKNCTMTATILRRPFAAITDEELDQFSRKMGALTSHRISRVLGFNRHRGRIYMLTEYFEGPLLRDRLTDRIPLPYHESLQIARQIAEALEDGHRIGLPHLNLQPTNIVLSSDGAKLVNYGFSRLTPPGQVSGRLLNVDSYDYLSPEQLARKEGDESSDIYALGTILYEMLTGHTPGVGRFKQASEENIQVTQATDVLIDHARERYPDKRYTRVADMGAEINRIVLTSLKGQPNQYIRVGLSWVTRFYRSLISKKFIIFTLAVLAGSLALVVIPAVPPVLNAAARLIFPMFFNSLLVSNMVDWAVRAIARRKGLGSLTTSGPAIGALFGLVFTINLISAAGFQECFQDPEILNSFGGILAIVLFETTLGFGIMLGTAWAGERFFKSFTSGFYWSFVVIVLLQLLLTFIHQPQGLFYCV